MIPPKFFCLISYVLGLLSFHTHGQPGTWTWMRGDSTVTYGYLGTQGVEDPATTPGSTYEGAEWTDLQGNFWLFGGYGYASSSLSNGYLNDLWKYNPTTNQWTWIKGDSTADFSYTNMESPEGRRGAVSWKDLQGNLWVYGGYGLYNFTFDCEI